MRVLVTTYPFGAVPSETTQKLTENGFEIVQNDLKRRFTESELLDRAFGFSAIIAGTEPISPKILAQNPDLAIISRVGIGLDNVPLLECRAANVPVAYTPDAPAPAVADLTIGLMLSLIRGINVANLDIRNGHWNRIFGMSLCDVSLGIIGFGRIGSRVANLAIRLGIGRIYCFDPYIDSVNADHDSIRFVDKKFLLANCNVITIHVPLTNETLDLLTAEEFSLCSERPFLINTSRGGIVNEADLLIALEAGVLSGAALDVFETEPYVGDLIEAPNCLLTCHMGSMTARSRAEMEKEAVESVVSFFAGEELHSLVPDFEYVNRQARDLL